MSATRAYLGPDKNNRSPTEETMGSFEGVVVKDAQFGEGEDEDAEQEG